MRNLGLIIDQIVRVAPDLEPDFKSLRSSVSYSAPELLPARWRQAAHILNSVALDHPKQEEIAQIFSGDDPE